MDLPPGTGDAQLTITEDIRVSGMFRIIPKIKFVDELAVHSGVVIVTSPQDVALADARKGAEMFLKLQPPVPVIGVINNFAHFLCANCGYQSNVFGSNSHLRKMTDELKVPLLGECIIEI